jgi:hypothetical protein
MKDKGRRVSEVVQVLKKLRGLGIPDSSPGMEELRGVLRQFVEAGEYANGHVDLPEAERRLVYSLHTTERDIEIVMKKHSY